MPLRNLSETLGDAWKKSVENGQKIDQRIKNNNQSLDNTIDQTRDNVLNHLRERDNGFYRPDSNYYFELKDGSAIRRRRLMEQEVDAEQADYGGGETEEERKKREAAEAAKAAADADAAGDKAGEEPATKEPSAADKEYQKLIDAGGGEKQTGISDTAPKATEEDELEGPPAPEATEEDEEDPEVSKKKRTIERLRNQGFDLPDDATDEEIQSARKARFYQGREDELSRKTARNKANIAYYEDMAKKENGVERPEIPTLKLVELVELVKVAVTQLHKLIVHRLMTRVTCLPNNGLAHQQEEQELYKM